MDINYIREFSVFAKYRNLSEAASELYSTQPVLSKHLATLEKELGVELLDRKSSPMQLTYAGEVFLEEACGLLTKWHRARARTKAAREGAGPVESIELGGMVNSAVLGYCMKAEEEYRERYHTTIYVKHKSQAYNTAKNLIHEGFLDISFEIYSRAMDVPGLLSQPLFVDDAVIVVEKDHRFANRKQVSFAELEDETHVTLNSNEDYSLREFCRVKCEEFGFLGGLPRDFLFKNALSYQQLLMQGLDGGILILPQSNCDFFPIFALEKYSIVPINKEDIQFDIRAFYSDPASKRVRQFLKCLDVAAKGGSKEE